MVTTPDGGDLTIARVVAVVEGRARDVQAPAFETKVRFAGVGSLTMTFVAVEGPLFVTTVV